MLESARALADARRNCEGRESHFERGQSLSSDRGEIVERFQEQDYADRYSPEGKPGISPVILAFVTVFQFMEKLPDWQAVESLRMRMD